MTRAPGGGWRARPAPSCPLSPARRSVHAHCATARACIAGGTEGATNKHAPPFFFTHRQQQQLLKLVVQHARRARVAHKGVQLGAGIHGGGGERKKKDRGRGKCAA